MKCGLSTDWKKEKCLPKICSLSRCLISPSHLRPYVRVTSWIHEEGASIEIVPESEPRGKYTLLHDGHLLVHHTSTYDSYKKYICKTEHILTGVRRRSEPARLTLTGKGPFTHSIENAVIESSSTLHRTFIDSRIFQWSFEDLGSFDDGCILN